MDVLTLRFGLPRHTRMGQSVADQSIWKGIAAICMALVLVLLSIGPVTRALSFPATVVPATHPPVAAVVSSKSIPAGLEGAIHRALGSGPIGLGTAPLVSGIARSSSGWSALAPHSGVSATISRSGSIHVSLGDKGPNGSLMARSIGTGTDGTATPLHVMSSTLVGSRLVQKMGPLSTSYQVTSAGLEQSFTIVKAPTGADGALVVDLGRATGWAVAGNGTSLIKQGANGSPSLLYGGLKSVDARGALLASDLRIMHGTAQIVVHGARTWSYPIVIDPIWTTSSTPTATLTNSAGALNSELGLSVALSADGTTAVIGAPGVNSSTGAAYVFHVSGEGSWATSSTPTATLTNSGGALGDQFGYSVALSADGTTAVIGAPGVSSHTGAAYVFHVSGEGAWSGSTSTPTATLTNSAGTPGGNFGQSVALSADGTTAVIGAVSVSSSAGAAYVFHVSGEGAWSGSMSTPMATLTNSGGALNGYFGSSVALSADGTTAVIAAIGVNSFTGAAYVFHVSGEGAWSGSTSTPTATLTNSGGALGDEFGSSVALSADGTTAVIGAIGESSSAGAAYVFHVSGEGAWSGSMSTPTATLTNSGGALGDQFGSSVALSADGTTAVIGAVSVSSSAGATDVFHVSGEGSWATSSTPTAILTNSGGASGDNFGYAVALSADGTTAVIGAVSVSSAYVFHVSGASWTTTSTPTATSINSGGASGDNFGYAVALSADGTTAVIAAPGVGSGTGAAYVFHVSGEGSWATSSTPTATLTNSAGASSDQFGLSVALSADGTTAVIGAIGVNSGTGAAYVFHVSGEGTWSGSMSTPTATLTNSGGGSGDQFGQSVALSADGTTAVIGAVGVSSGTGAAYVFHVAGEGSWSGSMSTPTATLTNSGGGSGDQFGQSVALSADGTTAVIGTNGVSSRTGAAYVFHVSGEGAWSGSTSTPTATLTNSGGGSGDQFGQSVALSADGTTAVIGAVGVSSGTGAAYVFHVAGEGSWSGSMSTPTATLTNSGGGSGDQFGQSVALSADGTTAVIGTNGVSSRTGAAYVFRVSGEGAWATSSIPTATLTNSGGALGDQFGRSVALSADGTTAVIGAVGVSASRGAAYVFHALATPTTPTISNLPASGIYGGGFTATVSTTADGAKTVTSNSTTICTTSGLVVSYVGVGTCSLTAHVAAGTNYTAADGVPQTFPIGQATPTTPTISNLPASGIYGGGFTATVSTTADGAKTVTSNSTTICTTSGLVVSYVGVGTCSLTAHVAAGTNYTAADGVPQTLPIGGGSGGAGGGGGVSSLPVVNSLTPTSGPLAGGTLVTVLGSGFSGATAVDFGSVAGTGLSVNSLGTSLTVSSPAATTPGTVSVSVLTPSGNSASGPAAEFSYVAPTLLYSAATPLRVLDTRTSSGGGPLGADVTRNLTLAGVDGVPADATVVTLNVTITDPSVATYLTLFPAGESLPLASDLNATAGETVAHLVEVPLGTGGAVSIYNYAGSADVVVDLEGYYAPGAGPAGEFVPLAPSRVLDTRTSSGGGPLGAGTTRALTLAGVGGVPSSGVAAVVLNLTATDTTEASYATIYPAGIPQPLASDLNWAKGQTVANLVTATLGTNGQVELYNHTGSTDLVVDVAGYITSASPGSIYNPVSPTRVLDTRTSSGGGPLAAGDTRSLVLAGLDGVPSGATAVVLNVTATNTTASSYMSLYPAGLVRPLASDLNWAKGQTVSNLVVVPLGTGGAIDLYNYLGNTAAVVDLEGYYTS